MLTPEQRQRLRRMTLDGASVQAIAKELGVSRTTVYAYQKDQSRGMRTRRPESGRKATLSRANQDELLQPSRASTATRPRLPSCCTRSLRTSALSGVLAQRSERASLLRHALPRPPQAQGAGLQAFFCEPGQQLQIDFTFGDFVLPTTSSPRRSASSRPSIRGRTRGSSWSAPGRRNRRG